MADNPSIISLDTAKQRGLKFYFTGEPCPHGHIAVRYTSNRACVECTKGWSKEWYSAPRNASKRAAKTKAWRTKNKEYDKIRQKKWRDENPEICRRLTRLWRAAKSERFKAKSKAWRDANRERSSVYNNSYRTRKRLNGGAHTVDDVKDIFAKQRARCALCGIRLGRKWHVDHIVSVRRGGSNDRRNLQILCQPCNNQKSSKDQIDFMRERWFLL